MANRTGLILYESLRKALADGYAPPKHQAGCGCHLPEVDVITAGYPCQPFSLAGKRRGENDPRHLWPYLWILLCHFRPPLILLENVPGHLSMGFGRVLGDLSLLRYDAEWQVLSAAGVGAPHLRRRLFVLAYPEGQRFLGMGNSTNTSKNKKEVANTVGGRSIRRFPVTGEKAIRWTYPETSGRSWWSTEPDVGRVAHGIPAWSHRIKSLGNAVVPQVAQKIGEWILKNTAMR